jgi:short-chain fatty acids transporter
MSNSIIIQGIIVALIGYWIVMKLAKEGFVGISINNYNYLVLAITLACCLRPRIFTELFIGTVQSAWAFIIQYPFYAGIFGIIVGTGFDKVIAEFFLSFATPQTWPSIAMLYSSIVNIFVPSAGSKFIIEAPYIIPISFSLNTKIETIVMAYSYGDCATNMLTPFWWVLPCGLFKVDYHKVLPYAVVASVLVTAFYYFALLLW